MRACDLPGNQIARLAAHRRKRFADMAEWQAHLAALGLDRQSPAPGRIATEAALWGCAVQRGVSPELRILSDDAGQFRLARHALCWVHLERAVHALPCASTAQAHAVERVRADLWGFYADLRAWRQAPEPKDAARLDRRFDTLFRRHTRHPGLNRLLARARDRKGELLAVLQMPELPLHTNAAENDLRAYVTRRKISAGTRSDQGRDARDACLGLLKTAAKHGISFWDYLADRLKIPGAAHVPFLPDLIAKPA
jgi:hypothetical protein